MSMIIDPQLLDTMEQQATTLVNWGTITLYGKEITVEFVLRQTSHLFEQEMTTKFERIIPTATEEVVKSTMETVIQHRNITRITEPRQGRPFKNEIPLLDAFTKIQLVEYLSLVRQLHAEGFRVAAIVTLVDANDITMTVNVVIEE